MRIAGCRCALTQSHRGPYRRTVRQDQQVPTVGSTFRGSTPRASMRRYNLLREIPSKRAARVRWPFAWRRAFTISRRSMVVRMRSSDPPEEPAWDSSSANPPATSSRGARASSVVMPPVGLAVLLSWSSIVLASVTSRTIPITLATCPSRLYTAEYVVSTQIWRPSRCRIHNWLRAGQRPLWSNCALGHRAWASVIPGEGWRSPEPEARSSCTAALEYPVIRSQFSQNPRNRRCRSITNSPSCGSDKTSRSATRRTSPAVAMASHSLTPVFLAIRSEAARPDRASPMDYTGPVSEVQRAADNGTYSAGWRGTKRKPGTLVGQSRAECNQA